MTVEDLHQWMKEAAARISTRTPPRGRIIHGEEGITYEEAHGYPGAEPSEAWYDERGINIFGERSQKMT